MPQRIPVNTLNASSQKILNTIRANAPMAYQNAVPVVEKTTDIPKVGDILYNDPSLANVFVNELVNRIAAVRLKSKIFNNPFARLKKGYLQYGETIEEIFVQIAQVQAYDVELAEKRRNKRTLPDVRTAFHAMNWRVQYPLTIQDEDLRAAFTGPEGVTDFIERLIEAVYQAAEYDEYLLFKYLIIKSVTKGGMHPVTVTATDPKEVVKLLRETRNRMAFRSTKFNKAGVNTVTAPDDACVFVDAAYEAEYTVDVLAAAFNIDKATIAGRVHIVDSFSEFDNDRWAAIRESGDMVEEVTAAELEMMKKVKAVLLDEDWFQVYDNVTKFTQDYIGPGMYWNYWLNIYKTVSTSPFANAVAFVSDTALSAPASYTAHITDKAKSRNALQFVIELDEKTALNGGNVQHIQTEGATTAVIAVKPYGVYTTNKSTGTFTPEITVDGVKYTASAAIDLSTVAENAVVTFNKAGAGGGGGAGGDGGSGGSGGGGGAGGDGGEG